MIIVLPHGRSGVIFIQGGLTVDLMLLWQLFMFTSRSVSAQHLEHIGYDKEQYEDDDGKQVTYIVCQETPIH